jgi:hypothetical protein
VICPYLVFLALITQAAGASSTVTSHAVGLGMIAIALSTLLQAHRLGPVGSGYLAPPVVSAIYFASALEAAHHYKGTLPFVASEQRTPRGMVEEQIFAAGLSGFLSSVFPDRLNSQQKRPQLLNFDDFPDVNVPANIRPSGKEQESSKIELQGRRKIHRRYVTMSRPVFTNPVHLIS